MSPRHSRRHHREDRHLCAGCRARQAKYRYHGQVRADRTHVLCFQCFRSAREQMRAQQLAQLPFDEPARVSLGAGAQRAKAAARLGNSASSAPLTASQLEHRKQMLAYLQSQAARCAR